MSRESEKIFTQLSRLATPIILCLCSSCYCVYIFLLSGSDIVIVKSVILLTVITFFLLRELNSNGSARRRTKLF